MLPTTLYRESGTTGKIKYEIELNVRLNRTLTKDDANDISPFIEKIKDVLFTRSVAINPDEQITAKIERDLLLSAFSSPIFVEEIPNGYCSQYCCKHKPWFVVTTKNGRIKIGCRKRVIEIDWSDSIIAFTAEDLFGGEDVTKGEKYIHAWGIEKAKEYIKTLEHTGITGRAS